MGYRKHLRKIIASILSMSYLFAFTSQYGSIAYAFGEETNSLQEYADNMLVEYLKDSDYASLENISLSSPFDYYNFQTGDICGTVYIVYHNEDVVGMLCIGDDSGEYSSSYLEGNIPYIQKAYDTDKNVAFGCYEQKVVCFDGVSFVDIQTDNAVDDYEMSMSIKTKKLSPYFKDFSDYIDPVAPCSVVYSAEIDIDPVSNEIVNDKGICWAASVAAKYNYENEYYKTEDDNGVISYDSGYVTARNVYDLVKLNTGEIPIGTSKYTCAALQLFGLTNSYKASALSATTIYGELYQDNAVIVSIANSDYSSGHSVIIAGVEYTVGSGTPTVKYKLCDSNFSELKMTIKCNESPYDKSINYYDAAYGYTFINWYQSYSYKWA